MRRESRRIRRKNGHILSRSWEKNLDDSFDLSKREGVIDEDISDKEGSECESSDISL